MIEDSIQSPQRYQKVPAGLMQLINPEFGQYNPYFFQTAQQNLYQLDHLEHVAQTPGKKFVYAHLMVTHPPFVFTPSGDLRFNMENTDPAYVDQIQYVNQRLLTIVKNILAQSTTPPVIILQGDHAFGWEEKGLDSFKVLNAYYLPQNGSQKLFANITPVNSFRLIFSTYFKEDLPLLPDQSIWINKTFPGGYQVVPQTCITNP